MDEKGGSARAEHHEEAYGDRAIFIEPSSDLHAKGLTWFVCKGDVEFASDLVFALACAFDVAHRCLDKVTQRLNPGEKC